jgi:Flp pilus assembly pilin Flp
MRQLFVLLHVLATEIRESERGQTMAENSVVLAVITLAVMGTLAFLAGGINDTLNSVTSTL